MNEIILSIFRKTCSFLPSEFEVMPMSRWNESAFRYFFCRFLAGDYPDVEQYIECDKIDLVLRQSSELAFIEFKFYRHPRRYDPYTGKPNGYKGGPGKQNLNEFWACVDVLNDRKKKPGLSKYVILVYSDPTDGTRPKNRYSDYYDYYKQYRDDMKVSLIETINPFEINDLIVKAQLYRVG